MPKRFKFLIVDDQAGIIQGYERFLLFLSIRNYLNKKDFEVITGGGKKGENIDKNLSMNFRVLSEMLNVDPKEIGYTFCEAFSEFKNIISSQEEYDFFIFDLKFAGKGANDDSNYMDPTFHENGKRANKCEEAMLYELDPTWKKPEEYTQPRDSSEKRKSRYIAGLQSFLLKMPIDERPKFIYSAAREAENLVKYMRILQARFSDVMILERGFHKIQQERGDVKEALNKLDSYLKKRQIEIIERQSISLRKKLIEFLDKETKLDDPVIPDDGDEDSCNRNPEKCWSLRSLFPKQINKIVISSNPVEKNLQKDFIKEILEGDWQISISDSYNGLLSHPEAFSEEKIMMLMETAKNLDFVVSGKVRNAGYKALTSMDHFSLDLIDGTRGIENLRDYVLDARINGQNINKKYLVNFAPIEMYITLSKYFESIQHNHVDWKMQICGNFGIYPQDIAYISHILYSNGKRRENQPNKFSINFCNYDKVEFKWEFPNNFDSAVFSEASRLWYKIEESNSNPSKLDDEGFADICKIICWRYNGDLDLYSKNFHLKVSRNGLVKSELKTRNGACQHCCLIIRIFKPGYKYEKA